MSNKRLSATDRVRAEIDGLFADVDRDLAEVLEEVAQLGVRLLMQSALEAEVTAFLGRERYERNSDARPGHRNGYAPTSVKTTAGRIELERPKVVGSLEAFSSRLLGKHVTRTNALESLVISGWVRGLSTRDVEAALKEALGPDASIGKSTVSRICEQITDEFEVWQARDLSDVELDYLFVDASHFKMHDGARAEPVLVAYGITTTGDPVFLHLAAVSAESTDACVDFLRDMVGRGLAPPLLTITDGAPGLCAAIDQVFGDSCRQRCLVHRCRNVVAKVSAADQDEVKADFWAIFDLPDDIDPGPAARAAARRRATAFADKWQSSYPAAVACVVDDLELLIAHLAFPRDHWTRVRHTNLIERTFGETRRRVKVIGRLPGETSALKLLWAVLDRASDGWRGITYTPADVRLLQTIKIDLGLARTRTPEEEPDHNSGNDTPVTAAA